MPFPRLNEEDFSRIQAALDDLLSKSESVAVLFVERAGYLIGQSGDTSSFDATIVATLAGNAYNAVQFMVDMLNEPNFSSMYQQGQERSVLWMKIDSESLLVAIFPPKQSVGMVKFFATATAKRIGELLIVATERAPEALFDIATEDPTDIGDMFKSKQAPPAEEAQPPEAPPEHQNPADPEQDNPKPLS